MNEIVKTKWVYRLRNGGLRQGKGRLRKATLNGDEFCCLGVLCEVAVEEGVIPPPESRDDALYTYGEVVGNRSSYILPDTVRKWAGLDDQNPVVAVDGVLWDLAGMNDDGKPFTEIADVIEEHL